MVPPVTVYEGDTWEGSNAFRVVIGDRAIMFMYCRTEGFININYAGALTCVYFLPTERTNNCNKRHPVTKMRYCGSIDTINTAIMVPSQV